MRASRQNLGKATTEASTQSYTVMYSGAAVLRHAGLTCIAFNFWHAADPVGLYDEGALGGADAMGAPLDKETSMRKLLGFKKCKLLLGGY